MTSRPDATTRGSVAAGLALIAFGILMLLGQLEMLGRLELLIVPALALIFLAWGLATHTFGLVIPGGILAGIALASYLIGQPFATVGETTQGAIFLLAFSTGWVLIALLSLFLTPRFQWWPLIPGGIMAALGALLLAGEAGLRVLQLAGYAWPLVLIALGAWIILRRRQ